MPANGGGGDWPKWATHVLKELERLNACEERHAEVIIDLRLEMEKRLGELNNSISTLKVKSGLWGAAAAMLPTIAAVLFIMFRGM